MNRLRRHPGGRLHIDATVLAIRSAHHELKSRVYEIGLYQSGLIGQSDVDDGAYAEAVHEESLD